MRRLFYIPFGIVCLMAGQLSVTRVDNPTAIWLSLMAFLPEESVFSGRSFSSQETPAARNTSVELVLDIESYEDPDFGFTMAIPAGWRRIVVADADSPSRSQTRETAELPIESSAMPHMDTAWLDPGYAVGFESVQQYGGDRFADYILVEILPGDASGLFAADVSRRHPVIIDGRTAWYDRVEINQTSSSLTDVDLVIYQAEFSGVGYTVGLYAIGEKASERLMAVAFEIMLQTFRIDEPPFSVT